MREKFEPERSVRGRATQGEQWHYVSHLQKRETTLDVLLRLSEDLSFDATQAFENDILGPGTETATAPNGTEEPDSPSEFPKCPSEIPLCSTGLLILCAALTIRPILSSNQPVHSLSRLNHAITSVGLATLFTTLQRFIHPDQYSPQPASPTVTDSALSLLYLALVTAPLHSLSLTQTEYMLTISTLLKVSATNPSQDLRDGAHHIASRIFGANGYNKSLSKSQVVRSLLQDAALDTPTVKAVILSWVKDEFATYTRKADAELPKEIPETKDQTAQWMDPSILDNDPELETLLFPTMPSMPTGTASIKDELVQHLTMLLPYYIASLNLYCVVRARTDLVSARAEMMVMHGLGPVLDFLLASGEMNPDIWALEDALNRARALAHASAD